MRKIDCFCGIGPWMQRDRSLPYKPEEMLALMDHFGIDSALVHGNFVSGDGSALRGNEIIEEACAKSERFMPMFTVMVFPDVNSHTPAVEEQMRRVKAGGGRSLWMVKPPGTEMLPWMLEDLLQPCVERKIPVFAHVNDFPPTQLSDLLDAFRGLRLVINGVGYAETKWLYPLMRRHDGLYACIGHYMIPPGMPKVFTDQFSSDRLLFGSGLPFFSPGGLITCVTYADLPDDEKEKIFSGNLLRLLNEARI